jgi:hypothetical protein
MPALIRSFTAFIVASIVLSACANEPSTGLQQTENAMLISGISGFAILTLVIVARWISARQWSSASRGGAIGFAFGLARDQPGAGSVSSRNIELA